MRRFAAVVAAVLAFVASGCGSGDRIVVAAGTTLVDSGAAAALAAAYEEETGVELSMVGASSQEALVLLAAGEAELALTHNPELERSFAQEHPDVPFASVFSSRFVLAGPPAVADRFGGLTVEDAFTLIHDSGMDFVSRNDGSGTATKEAAIWAAAGRDPFGRDWHIVTGGGMGTTLQIADQRGALTLAEVGALFGADGVSLVATEAVHGSVSLANPYTLWNGDQDDARLVDVAVWIEANGASVLSSFAESQWGMEVYMSPGG